MKKVKQEFKEIIYSDKEILNGTPCFRGTRVPVSVILEYLSLGWSINDLKKSYPTVKSEYISLLIKTMSSELIINVKAA